MYLHEWNNMQYASSAAFLLAVYSDYLSAENAVLKCPDAQVQPHELLDFAKSQVDIRNLLTLSINLLMSTNFFMCLVETGRLHSGEKSQVHELLSWFWAGVSTPCSSQRFFNYSPIHPPLYDWMCGGI